MNMDTATIVEFDTDSEAHDFAAFLLDLRGSNYGVLYDYSTDCVVAYEINDDLAIDDQSDLQNKINNFL